MEAVRDDADAPLEGAAVVLVVAVLEHGVRHTASACRVECRPRLSERLAAAVAGMRAALEAGDERTFFDHHWAFYEAMYRSTNAFLFRAYVLIGPRLAMLLTASSIAACASTSDIR